MPHARRRHVLNLLERRLKFFRVVCLQGARQTGKSFLARELLKDGIKNYVYKTFDVKSERSFAESNPDTFLEKYSSAQTLALDEAQKVPDIFDAVKFVVDQNNRPGQYLLLGSTEFSKELKIRESLTGRMSRVRIFPFNIGETLSLKPNPSKSSILSNLKPRVTRLQLLKYLDHGGFPGIFHVRDESSQTALFEDWIRLVCERDLLQFSQFKLDGGFAKELLRQIAICHEPILPVLTKALGGTTWKTQQHLRVLEQLFVLHVLRPHPLGSGKKRYLLCDPGLCRHLGGNFSRQLETWFWLEQLSQSSSKGVIGESLFYYRSARGGILDLIVEGKNGQTSALKLIANEGYDKRDFEILRAFSKKFKDFRKKAVDLHVLAPIKNPTTDSEIKLHPWESLG
jgi:predicted AAA+ superfamily ATPase